MWLTVLGAVVLVLSLILHTTMALLVTGLLGAFLAGLWWLLPSCGSGPDERLAAGEGQINLATGPFFGIGPTPSAERDGDAVMDSQGSEADRRRDRSPGARQRWPGAKLDEQLALYGRKSRYSAGGGIRRNGALGGNDRPLASRHAFGTREHSDCEETGNDNH